MRALDRGIVSIGSVEYSHKPKLLWRKPGNEKIEHGRSLFYSLQWATRLRDLVKVSFVTGFFMESMTFVGVIVVWIQKVVIFNLVSVLLFHPR